VVERSCTGFVARNFQHEDDHLRGLVFLDRLESSRDVITENEYQKRLASTTATAPGAAATT
jgi:peptide deformylase